MMIGIQDELFDADEIRSRLVSPRVGAVVTFTGVVRGQTGGLKTESLEFQVYEELAEKNLMKLEEDIREQFPVEDLVILHRRGVLVAGEPIVFIAVASARRKEAFRACELAIDRLKREIPIWKKELTTDGEFWVEGEGCDL